MTQLSWIPPQFIKLGQAGRSDLSQWVVYGIHIAQGSSEGKPRAWVVNQNNTNGGEIAIPTEGGKTDSVSCLILPDGGVRFVTSRAVAPGASGSTAVPFASVVPGVFPPMASAGSGSGFVEAPNGYIRVFSEEAGFEGERTIDLSSFGIPAGVSGLTLRVSAIAEAKDRTLRAAPNTIGAGASSICAWTQSPDTRIYDSGTIGPGDGHTIVVWTSAGKIKQGWVDVTGWFY